MNIIYIEPYYAGSHKKWIDSYKKYSKHNITILHLPGNKWKWRMHGGAITLATQFLNLDQKTDLILCSDFLNLPVFKSVCGNKIDSIPIGMYFHENQLSYPWSPKDDDMKLNRDLHYHYINYTSSLVSDFNLFNSNFHLSSYIFSIKKYLKKMPDFNNFETIDTISKKSSILYIGCELNKIQSYKVINKNNKPLILWNHRWEFDKNPDLFFQTLYKLKENKNDFQLAVLGEHFKEYPSIFDEAQNILADHIVYFGYCQSFEEYANWLWKADIIPVTSNQDFFGISIIEAISAGVYPILPNKLSYPEILDINSNAENFYSNNSELYEKLHDYLINYKFLRKSTTKYIKLINRFDWSNMIEIYDKTFEIYYKN